jgi:hypothetical protein
MRTTTRQTRDNRTITVDFRDEATYFQLLDDRKAFLECVLAFVMSLGLKEEKSRHVTGSSTCKSSRRVAFDEW